MSPVSNFAESMLILKPLKGQMMYKIAVGINSTVTSQVYTGETPRGDIRELFTQV